MTKFKADIVESPTYYSSKRKYLILFFLTNPLFLILSINHWYNRIPLWIIVGIAIVAIAALIYQFKIGFKMVNHSNNRTLIIDEKSVIILSKNGKELSSFKIQDMDKIVISKSHSDSQDSLKDIKNEMAGKPKVNFIELEKGNQKDRFNFIIESDYLLVQLNKIINNWISSGREIRVL